METLAVFLLVLALQGVTSQNRQEACEQSSCYPATGDLLIGREDRLDVSSTCGYYRPARYCIVSHLEDKDRNQCFVCDSRQPYFAGDNQGLCRNHDLCYNYRSHRIENIVSTFRQGWKERWWQAENGAENVFVQLDLEGEFHFTHLIMRFKTFRPAAMLVERSYDFGKTWKVYRYFAYDCAKSFPGIRTGPINSINDVICESRYSDVAPSTEGEVVFRVLPPYIEIEDPYSQEVQDLLKMTNLRVNFTKLHTLGDTLLDNRDVIKEKYYYALYDMVVRGSCSCYGHASRCVPLPGQPNNPNMGNYENVQDHMVHGKCECTHNTKGINCQECDDFYNDLPWKPAQGRDVNACKKCECNNHAGRCHFDPAVYELTGRVSGGLCDDCQHNTTGRNCEECKPFFYQDPSRPINDPYVCRPCDCDPVGSEHGGECESRTDPRNDLVAGRCICKRFVEGRRCDVCRNGFWNLRPDDPSGCESCSCNLMGTIGNYGCDKRTGECRCKRYVTGRNCDQCFPQHWGLGDDAEGCKACDCDAGGSLSNDCDQNTGQCQCKPNIVGRRCDQPASGFFVPGLDYMKYEGEFAQGIGNTQVVIREPLPGRAITWTGPGFMRVSEGSSLEFIVDDVPYSMEYDILIRYEPQMSERWEDVRVTIVRPTAVSQQGPCANTIPQDDLKAFTLPSVVRRTRSADVDANRPGEEANEALLPSSGEEPPAADEGLLPPSDPDSSWDTVYDYQGSPVLSGTPDWAGGRYYVISPSACLETGVSYRIRLDFQRYRSDRPTPEANVLVDSIALIPSTFSIPIFQGSGLADRRRQEFEYYRCQESQMPVVKEDVAEICRSLTFSVSSSLYDRALECGCDATGSLNGLCNAIGGDCQCKQNVIGRRCDQCAPGTFGFGPSGCRPCNCNAIGSRDNFCEPNSGQCMCNPNVFGRQCDQCQRGFFGFPNCRACQCNGRADECDNLSGQCLQCRDNTGGSNCDRCAVGYYGDPRPGSTIGCRQCMCPGGEGSGFQHGDTCRLDTRTNQVTCDCREGFTGNSCDRCADNFYGNPLVPGGTCERCNCNNNVDPDATGNCDADTGECLRCQYNSYGFNCEFCQPGYYGDASRQNCLECNCNILGTDRGAGQCDSRNGQCPCLPNVVGQQCDRCAANYWKIASGLGCESCSCDPDGSLSSQCNEFDGQCRCKPGRGGRDCSQCQDFYWGNPNVRCYPCNCNTEGSTTQQCDRSTGVCPCTEGVAGRNCDRCARGTTGQLPYCVPCGECFDNWDTIIKELHLETDRLIQEGSDIKVGGAPGAFDKEFKDMEDKLEEVKRILSGTNVTEVDLDQLREKLEVIRRNLTDSEDSLEGVDTELEDTTNRIETANNRIDSIKRRVDALKREAEQLKANATSIRELDVTGAYNSTKESQRRSQAAQDRVDATGDIVEDSMVIRAQIDDLIDRNQDSWDEKYDSNEETLRDLNEQVDRIDDKIAGLNEIMCNSEEYPCDDVCGGAGCGKCGGLSCDGAVDKTKTALEFAKDAEAKLKDKASQADDLLQQVTDVQDVVNMAKGDAQMAYDEAQRVKNQSESARADLQDLIDRIDGYLTDRGARPAEIRAVAEEVLAMTISLTPEEIRDLAQQINDTIQGLTDIDRILDETREDLANANNLKDRADDAKSAADDILNTAQAVLDALEKAKAAQDKATTAIDQANQDIADAQDDLTMIESETEAAEERSANTLLVVDELKTRLSGVKTQYTENDFNVRKATLESDRASELAMQAESKAVELETKYSEMSIQLETKYNETQEVKKRADLLRDRAAFLYQDTYGKVQKLKVMDAEFESNEKTLSDLSGEIAKLTNRMIVYVQEIQAAASYHRTCE